VAGVDPFRRGKDWASRGHVVQPSLQRNGQLLIGQVRGRSSRPYATTATARKAALFDRVLSGARAFGRRYAL
jgi:hypothetical protein